MNTDIEKLASSLAVYAVHGDRTELEKCALGEGLAASLQNVGSQAGTALKDVYSKAQPYLADPYVRNALMGAGAGGLIGLMQPKRKLRNMLSYGLVGGLGGAGLTAGVNAMTGKGVVPPAGDVPATVGPAGAALAKASPEVLAAKQERNNDFINPRTMNPAGAIAGGAGGFAAGRSIVRNRLLSSEAAKNPAEVLNRAPAERLPLASRAAKQRIENAVQKGQPLPVVTPAEVKGAIPHARMTGRQKLLSGGAGAATGVLGAFGGRALGDWAGNAYLRAMYPNAYP